MTVIFMSVCVAQLHKKCARRNDAESLLHRADIPGQLFNFFLSKNVPNLDKTQVKNRIWVQGYNKPSFVQFGREMEKKNIRSPRMMYVVHTK